MAVLDEGEEVTESQHAAEGLGPVAHGFVELAPQLAFADVEVPAQFADARPRRRSSDDVDGGVDIRVERSHARQPEEDRLLEDRLLRLDGGGGRELFGDDADIAAPQGIEIDAAIGELVGSYTEEARGTSGTKADADGECPIGQANDVAGGVRAGNGEGLVADPDDVDAAVRKDAH